MLDRGVYVHPWHNMFLCAAMTEADIDGAAERRRGRVRRAEDAIARPCSRSRSWRS